jgi:hypothetical protein
VFCEEASKYQALPATAPATLPGLIYGSTPLVSGPPPRPPLISTLTSSTCLLIPSILRTRLRVFQSQHGLAVAWTSLQLRRVSYVVCALLLPPCHLPNPQRTPVPPLVLLTQQLPWTVWIAHKPLSPLSTWILPMRPQGCCPHPALSATVPRCPSCLVLWTLSVMTRSPFLVCMSDPQGNRQLMLRPPCLQIVMMNFPFCAFLPALLWFRAVVMMRFLLRALCFLAPHPLPVLICMSHANGNLLLVLRPHRMHIAMMKFPCCVFHPALLWFCVIEMMRFSFRDSRPSFTSRALVSPAPQACGCGRCPLRYGCYPFESSPSAHFAKPWLYNGAHSLIWVGLHGKLQREYCT